MVASASMTLDLPEPFCPIQDSLQAILIEVDIDFLEVFEPAYFEAVNAHR
jgi:hypothetical protein